MRDGCIARITHHASRITHQDWGDTMGKTTTIVNTRTGETIAREVVKCNTFLKRAIGLMFHTRRAVAGERVYLFEYGRESVSQTTIHMLFCFFPIAVLWLDSNNTVVDTRLARPWRPYYAPRRPARAFAEGDPSLLGRVSAGDRLEFRPGSQS
jgi:uncharacterized membrane protein (UPF0127 family)